MEKNVSLLTSYHFYNEKNPERTNADSSNAKSLMNHAKTSGQPTMLFEALHLPAKDTLDLQKIPPNEFQNLRYKLYLIPGAPIILTSNINNTVKLFNGSSGTFVGPLYLQKKYSLKDFATFQNTAVDVNTLKTTKPVDIFIQNGSKSVLPQGSPLTEINRQNVDISSFSLINADNFDTATFLLPRKPPFQPDYLVIEIKGYADCGGPPFFPSIHRMRDYVCIPARQFERKVDGRVCKQYKKFRTQFPVELAYTMTTFKGIGATHERTELKLKGIFGTPGVFLVGTTRVKNPKHLYIPPGHWPSASEVSSQRQRASVLQSKTFERVVRAKSAQELRKSEYFMTIQGFPPLPQEVVNEYADYIRSFWKEKGHILKKNNSEKDYVKKKVLEKCSVPDPDIYDQIETFMRSTDEVLLLKKGKLVNTNTESFLKKKENSKREAKEYLVQPKHIASEPSLHKSHEKIRKYSANIETPGMHSSLKPNISHSMNFISKISIIQGIYY